MEEQLYQQIDDPCEFKDFYQSIEVFPLYYHIENTLCAIE